MFEKSLIEVPWGPLLFRVLVSLICGSVIGAEREWARKAAGLRTMILICMGSNLYMLVSQLAAITAGFPFDITRIASQVVTGVGFIGAGAIIVDRGRTIGVTTAASIWVVAAIGLIIGAG
ncbi:MAG: MgtC/SapB family protein, partial [bacterium]